MIDWPHVRAIGRASRLHRMTPELMRLVCVIARHDMVAPDRVIDRCESYDTTVCRLEHSARGLVRAIRSLADAVTELRRADDESRRRLCELYRDRDPGEENQGP